MSPFTSSRAEVKVTPSATRPPGCVALAISKWLNHDLMISPGERVSTGPEAPATLMVALDM